LVGVRRRCGVVFTDYGTAHVAVASDGEVEVSTIDDNPIRKGKVDGYSHLATGVNSGGTQLIGHSEGSSFCIELVGLQCAVFCRQKHRQLAENEGNKEEKNEKFHW